jgi:hypothetical protein
MALRSVAAMSLAIVSVVLCLAGCGRVQETLPPRSAMEQLLISTAGDRAVAGMPLGDLDGKAVFLDTANLDCYDKPYLVQRLRHAVLDNGGRIAEKREEAQVVLQVASGSLSINKREFLLGLPAIPIPIPMAGTLELPELAIVKAVHHRGRAKLLVSAIDPKTNGAALELPVCYGKARNSNWWFLFLGPFEFNDLPKEAR